MNPSTDAIENIVSQVFISFYRWTLQQCFVSVLEIIPGVTCDKIDDDISVHFKIQRKLLLSQYTAALREKCRVRIFITVALGRMKLPLTQLYSESVALD